MRYKIKFSFLLVMIFMLAGCASLRHSAGSLFHKSDRAYLKTQSKPSLSMPQGLTNAKFSSDYHIPSMTSTAKIPASTKPPFEQSTKQNTAKSVTIATAKSKPHGWFLKPFF